MSGVNALQLSPADNVAVALSDIPAGARARCRSGGGFREVETLEMIPLGHKLALAPIAAGASVMKYGAVIASARAAVAAGAHVHVHNIASNRARAGA